MAIAIFPGSFDPLTNGHVEVVEKAADLFDQVYVVIMTNTHKKYLFSADERASLARDALKKLPNVCVLKKPSSLTVNVARELGAKAIVRGVRNTEDFLYEQQIAGLNERLAPDIHTVLIFTKPDSSFVASSMIKEVARFHGDISQFLPSKAAKALIKKMAAKHEKK